MLAGEAAWRIPNAQKHLQIISTAGFQDQNSRRKEKKVFERLPVDWQQIQPGRCDC